MNQAISCLPISRYLRRNDNDDDGLVSRQSQGLIFIEGCKSILHRMIDDVLDLEFVFVVIMSVGQLPELLSKIKTMSYVLRRDKVFGDLDAGGQVPYLMRSSCRNLRLHKTEQ